MTGWKLVPVEATEEMGRVSGMREVLPIPCAAFTQWAVNKWPDMLQAAPAPPDPVLERMARAFLERYANGPAGTRFDHIASMRAALAAAEERT